MILSSGDATPSPNTYTLPSLLGSRIPPRPATPWQGDRSWGDLTQTMPRPPDRLGTLWWAQIALRRRPLLIPCWVGSLCLEVCIKTKMLASSTINPFMHIWMEQVFRRFRRFGCAYKSPRSLDLEIWRFLCWQTNRQQTDGQNNYLRMTLLTERYSFHGAIQLEWIYCQS